MITTKRFWHALLAAAVFAFVTAHVPASQAAGTGPEAQSQQNAARPHRHGPPGKGWVHERHQRTAATVAKARTRPATVGRSGGRRV